MRHRPRSPPQVTLRRTTITKSRSLRFLSRRSFSRQHFVLEPIFDDFFDLGEVFGVVKHGGPLPKGVRECR
jgi:hypothetical protein